MIKLTVFYDKEFGQLNVASTGKRGNLKVLDDNLNWFVIPKDEVYITKKYIESNSIISYIVLNNKEKISLENDLITEICLLTAETLDVIKQKVIDDYNTKLSVGQSLKSSILESFEISIKNELEAIDYLGFQTLVENKLLDEFVEIEVESPLLDVTYQYQSE